MANKRNETSISKPAPKDCPRALDTPMFYGVTLDEEQIQFVNTALNPDIDIVFVNARAGVGKTFLATGVANLLTYYNVFDNIVYIMSPYGERKQGYMPGSITEKSSVYFEAFYQALADCDINPHTAISNESMANQKSGGYITCITDTFLRGSNLNNSVIIIDEAQNFTTSQLKKVLTRIGTNAKVIVIGHDKQCDLDNPRQSGFIKYLEHYRNMPRAAVCSLSINHRGWISQHADELPD